MEGYAQIAGFMGHACEMAIFRRFSTLSLQNLLYLQAELVELESELVQLANEQQQPGHPNKPYYKTNWWFLSHSEDDGDGKQWQKVLEIRAKLKEYRESHSVPHTLLSAGEGDSIFCAALTSSVDTCLEQYAFLSRLGGPSKYDLDIFQHWLRGLSRFPLTGNDRETWTNPDGINDLVALSNRDRDDVLSKVFLNRLIPIFHWTLGNRLKKRSSSTPGLAEYDNAHLLAILEVTSTMISSMLPISSIIILYFVRSTPARLGIVVGYTALFSMALALLTRASRVENFAATAALVCPTHLLSEVFDADDLVALLRCRWSSLVVMAM